MEGASQHKRGHNRINRLAEHEQGTSSKNNLSWSKGSDTCKQASYRINSLPAATEERKQDGCPALTPRDPGRRRRRRGQWRLWEGGEERWDGHQDERHLLRPLVVIGPAWAACLRTINSAQLEPHKCLREAECSP
jgi:hypothetical protein